MSPRKVYGQMEKFKRKWMTVTDEHSGQPLVATLTEVKNSIT
jgi:hypothetical protein